MAKKQKEGSGCLVVWHRFESAPEGIAVSNLPNLKRLNYLKLRGVSLAAIAGFHGIKFAQNDSNADELTFPIFSAKMVKFQLFPTPRLLHASKRYFRAPARTRCRCTLIRTGVDSRLALVLLLIASL